MPKAARVCRFAALCTGCVAVHFATVRAADDAPRVINISGRYPHLAMFNHDGECGTGAVVPWADRLWVITYAPHEPHGSDDKLYEIDADLKRVARPESVGGTPADRMIHRESKQLIIGPYFIDEQRNVRVVPPSKMPGRLTAVASHLTDPENKVYFYDMEGALYEVDVHTLAVKKLFARCAPGAHGKGAYTGQGRLVIANNGDEVVNKAKPALDDPLYKKDPEAAGILAQWDGKKWETIERRQFTEVTGPGGISGASRENTDVWAVGWDKRSIILELLGQGDWYSVRLPVSDYSYVAKHGWYTEWPRIRDVDPEALINMHGGWFEVPRIRSTSNLWRTVRPLGDYLKITGDFCRWDGRLVFGCDDASDMQNPLDLQSQSNLWFAKWDDLERCGRPAGYGGPWIDDAVNERDPSPAYLMQGYDQRVLHLANDSDATVGFKLQYNNDRPLSPEWTDHESITVPPHGYGWYVFPDTIRPAWVRIVTDRDCSRATAYFHYGPGGGKVTDRKLFTTLVEPEDIGSWSAGRLRPLGDDRGTLLFDALIIGTHGKTVRSQALEITPDMHFKHYDGPPVAEPKTLGADEGYDVTADEASIVVNWDKRRFRLPVADRDCDECGEGGPQRKIRECVTERFLLNAGGSFFCVPRPTAGGAARMKPVCSHEKRITDFCSWRGLMVLAGCRTKAQPDGHYFAAEGADSSYGLWFGDIDDLWKLGKPHGRGGPWLKTTVKAAEPSDPFLMLGYDHKTVELSHDAAATARITLEIDFLGNNTWHEFKSFEVPADKTISYEFPTGYSAHWIRARSDTPCKATVQFAYD